MPAPSEPGAGRRERRKAVTRRELLHAGRRLFGEKGLYESRIEDLTRRAGIAKGTLYLYFRSKEDLIHAVAAQGFDELHQEMVRACRGARTVRDLSGRIAWAHLTFFARHPDLMLVFHQVRGMLKFNRPRWQPLRGLLAAHLDRIAALHGALPEGKAPRPAVRARLAIVLFGAVSGAASVRAVVRPGASLDPWRRDLAAAAGSLAEAFIRSEEDET
ncbi:MAG TPA: helix-turn-helix domain-containing protein [Candidatus Polarisedimenticolia bacterium]|nr:helix-turn-helix domain-containing protein [Candidatus Polarisedimenticolia bacterium]